MRILIFSTAYFPLVGGAEIAVKEITDRIEGYDFELITSRFSKQNAKKEKIGNITVYRVGFGMKLDKYFLPILGFLKAKKLFKENKYSLIWSMNASQAGLAALFFKLKNPKLPFLLTLQEGSSERRIFWRRFMVWPLFKLIFKKADYVQTISKHLANFGKKMGADCPIKVVPNGVNIENFSKDYSEEQLEQIKNKLNKGRDDKFIIHTGRLVSKNALDDVIKALPHLSENIKFLLLGIGSDLGKLQNLAKKLKVENRVIFLGHFDQEGMVKYLKISDIFIRPSISEGLGNSFLEAMATGVPIIGTPVGGIPDFLKHEETGLFCKPRQPQTIAKQIKILIKDKKLRDKLIKNAKKIVKEVYSWDRISNEIKNIYKKMIYE